MKPDDLNRDLIDMLCFWWRYEQRSALSRLGYPKECPSTQGWRASKQYDFDTAPDVDGYEREPTAWVDARGAMAEQIGKIVNGMDEPFRTALYVLARNRATGARVWMSPRLPTDEMQRGLLVAEALARFGEKV